MKHSRFAKATSIVMSAVVAAAGYSVCAKQVSTASNKSEKPFVKAIGDKMLSMLKATPKSEWTMGAAGCIIGIASTAGIYHFIAHDTLKDLAAHILTFTDSACGFTRLLILKIKSCDLPDGTKGPAILVLCDNEAFANKYSTESKESDGVPKFNLNALVSLNSENSASLQAWQNHIGAERRAKTRGKLKGSTLETLGTATGLDPKNISCENARSYFDTIQSLTSTGGKPTGPDKQDNREKKGNNASTKPEGITESKKENSASNEENECIALIFPVAVAKQAVTADASKKGSQIDVWIENTLYQATLAKDYEQGINETDAVEVVISVPKKDVVKAEDSSYSLTIYDEEDKENKIFNKLQEAT